MVNKISLARFNSTYSDHSKRRYLARVCRVVEGTSLPRVKEVSGRCIWKETRGKNAYFPFQTLPRLCYGTKQSRRMFYNQYKMIKQYLVLWQKHRVLQMMLDIMESTERTLLLYILALFYRRIVPHLSSGVVSLTSFSSFCTTPQRGSLRRSRLGSTKEGKLFRATWTCISVGKQRMTKPCLNPENGTEGS